MSSSAQLIHRPSNGWATAEDWAAHRPIITVLYRDQNKTLKQTMQVMQDDHDFYATVRMYKARFQQWGIEKKIKAEDAVEIFRQQTARAKAGKPSIAYVRGRRINPERLQRYRYRAAAAVSEQIMLAEQSSGGDSSPESSGHGSNVLCRTPSPEPYDTPRSSISPRLDDPPELKVPNEVMQILGNYVVGSFEAGVWARTDPDKVEVNDAFTWAHYLATSQGLISHNRIKEGFFLLHICFDQYKAHLQQPDSFFWLATYKAAMVLAHKDSKLADTFVAYASKLTSLTLPAGHPFNLAWKRIMLTGVPGLLQHAAALFQSYLDSWRRGLTGVDADHNSIVQMAFVFIQLHCSGMITYAFLREMTEMMMSLLVTSKAATQFLLQEAKFRLACYFLENEKYNKAEVEIEDIISWLDNQPREAYIHLRIKCAWTIFEIRQAKGINIEALQVGYELLALCQETYGFIHLQTLDAMSAVENLLRQMGNKPITQRLTQDFESRWKAFHEQARTNKGFPHMIEKPWFHRCIELKEDQSYIQETIDLFESCTWLEGA